MWKKKERNVQMFHGSASATTIVDKVVTDDGVASVKTVSKSLKERYKELPEKENFSLEAQLKAGVKLQEVNSNVLSPEEPNLEKLPNEPVESTESSDTTE